MSNAARERGQVVMFVALMIPVFLAMGAVVVGGGNWFVHAKHLQTKVDASALAAGSAWSFPCTAGSDAPITTAARDYVGPHTDDVGTLHSGRYNEQVGEVPGDDVQVRLNANDWFDDDVFAATGVNPSDFTTPPGGVCVAKTLDVKATEVDSFPLASIIPVFPDLKRKARVEIQESAETAGPGLLPLAVRVPKPLNAAAVYVNETPGVDFGNILSAVYLNDVCEQPAFANCVTNMPSGLDHWTSDDGSGGNVATVSSMPSKVGVVVALSSRPKCGSGPACFAINQPTIDQLCNQGTSAIAQCFYTTGTTTQTFRSGLQFIRGWSSAPSPGDQEPDLLSTWIQSPITGTFCQGYHGYFSAPVANNCTVTLRATVDPGFNGLGNYEIRYKHVAGNDSALSDDPVPGGCDNNWNASCVMTADTASVELPTAYARHAFAFAIFRYNLPLAFVQNNNLPAACADPAPHPSCSWYYPDLNGNLRGTASPSGSNGRDRIFANPVQRAFMGDINRSGPVKYLHLKNVDCADGDNVFFGLTETGQAASVQSGQRCFRLEMGLQGALARDQNEYPIQINIGTTSQSAVVDCDPAPSSNLMTEIELGCGTPDGFPSYTAHDFAVADTGSGPQNTPYCPDIVSQQFFDLPKPAPYDKWSPFTCVLTQTCNNCNQIERGFSMRIFGTNNPTSCPADNALYVKGRNYWHDANNSFAADPDGNGPLAVQQDFYTFARSAPPEPLVGGTQPHPNRLRLDDPRFVLLFISPYNSFTGQGNANYPITAIGGFYITGYGSISGSQQNPSFAVEDPCAMGNGLGVGAGNTPPPDLDITGGPAAVAWGHFVTAVNLSAPGGGNGNPCQEASPTACVPVLVE